MRRNIGLAVIDGRSHGGLLCSDLRWSSQGAPPGDVDGQCTKTALTASPASVAAMAASSSAKGYVVTNFSSGNRP